MKIKIIKRSSRQQEKELIISISKKDIKKATTRNKVKRRIKNIMTPYLKGDHYFIIVKKGAENLAFSDFKKEIENQL